MKKILYFLTLTSCFNSTVFAGNCAQTGGNLDCISAIPPHYTGPWIYTSATNKTPVEGRSTLSEAMSDYENYLTYLKFQSYAIKKEENLYFLASPMNDLPFLVRLNMIGTYSRDGKNHSSMGI